MTADSFTSSISFEEIENWLKNDAVDALCSNEAMYIYISFFEIGTTSLALLLGTISNAKNYPLSLVVASSLLSFFMIAAIVEISDVDDTFYQNHTEAGLVLAALTPLCIATLGLFFASIVESKDNRTDSVVNLPMSNPQADSTSRRCSFSSTSGSGTNAGLPASDPYRDVTL